MSELADRGDAERGLLVPLTWEQAPEDDNPPPCDPPPTMPTDPPRYQVTHVADIEPTPCPCGSTRRAFVEDPDRVASLHVVETDGAARTHYHKRLTEIYYVLEGEGVIELDGESFDVRPGSTVLIKPLCRHRLVGRMRFINVPVPSFDPDDEWFD